MSPCRSLQAVARRLFTFAFLLSLLGGALPAAGDAPAVLDKFVYLPLTRKSYSDSSGLYGTVTEKGVPAASVPLTLYRQGSGGSTVIDTTLTASDGSYGFAGAPTLGADQLYQVHFYNTSDETRLQKWTTAALSAYAVGQAVHMGDFDIAGIPLLEPVPGAEFSAANDWFRWTKRMASPTDNYAVAFYKSTNSGPFPSALTGSLGWVEQHWIGSPPHGFDTGVVYTWTVHIIGAEGLFGTNFYRRALCFSSCLASQSGAPGMNEASSRLLGPAWMDVQQVNEK
jgi:hypothetical protein